jgi:glycosyltransferase involved in cell wall biosynthesis
LVPAFDVPAAILAIERVLMEDQSDPGRVHARRRLIAEQYRFDRYGFRLLQLLEPRWRSISVIVPNYNYERYLEARLQTIFDQTEPVFEIIVLDDCSTDASLECLERLRAKSGRIFSIISNTVNSGSIIRQWQLGAESASGEFLWIAEADDQSDVSFLAELLTSARPDDVLFAFCDSAQIDGEGNSLGHSYGFYYKLEGEALCTTSFTMPAVEFAQKHLAVRNLILNVSSILYRRIPLLETLNEHIETLRTFSFAGDWFLYTTLCLKGGRVAYVASSLNIHRRHAESAVHSTRKEKHLEEIRRVHRFLEEVFDDETGALRRPRYIEELREQFGIQWQKGELTTAAPRTRCGSVAPTGRLVSGSS